MAERSVRVRLTAVIDDFRRNMGDAAKATEQVGDAAQDAEKKSDKLGDSARAVGKFALTGLAVATTATVALGTAALKTGIQYNALEQTSRAALTTLLGSSEAAADQMERLREFVRTSPFPREVWIEAQQTLLAFGLEASRVIPTLDAIQDAAAAAGLSTHEIGGLVEIFARIQSSGRITGQELRQFAIRGIDAAGLLGQAYGKTADEIRQDITSGAIDGRQALVDLTAQMTATFGGAAENVRQTWAGALDSLRGAFRDVGSVLAAPFVDPMGGGAAVDWARSLADALRALETVLGPVVATLGQRATPAFEAVTRALENASEALRSADIDRVTEQLTHFSPAIAGLGAAGAAASTGLIPFVRTMSPQGALIAGLVAFAVAVPEVRTLLFDILDAVAPLGPPLAEVAAIFAGTLASGLAAVATLADPVVSLLGGALDLFSSLPGPIQSVTLGLGALGLALRLSGPVGIALAALSALGAVMDIISDKTHNIEMNIGTLADSLDPVSGAITDATRELAFNELEMGGWNAQAEKLGINSKDMVDAFLGQEGALERVRSKLLDVVDAGTEMRGASWQQFEVLDANAQIAQELFDVLDGGVGNVDEAREAIRRAGEAGIISASQTEELTEAFTEVGDEVGVAADQLETYLDTVKRATDPVYALHGALSDVEAAQEAYNEAVEEYGPKSKEAQDAAFNLMRQLDKLEEAAINGELSFDEFEARLDEWVRQGKITSGQADATKARVKSLREEAEDYKGRYNATISQTGADGTMRKIRSVKALVESFKDKGITLTVNAQTGAFKVVGRGFAGEIASGGEIHGPGTPTSDSIMAFLSDGEFVVRAKSVDKYGPAMMHAINEGRFASGGLVGLKLDHKAKDSFATDFPGDFASTLGRNAARAGKTLAGTRPGRVLPRGSYRIGMPYLGYPGHYGADYPAPAGTPVHAMAAGVVERAVRMATSYGNHIFLRHANGIQTRYAHMLGLRATAGQAVGPGQPIGWVGSSGNSTGPHLHFEYRRHGAPSDPARLGIFDRGGVLPSGGVAANMSTKPEAVLTDRQWATMHAAAAAAGGAAGPAQLNITIDGDGSLPESIKAAHRKGEVRITLDGRPVQVS